MIVKEISYEKHKEILTKTTGALQNLQEQVIFTNVPLDTK